MQFTSEMNVLPVSLLHNVVGHGFGRLVGASEPIQHVVQRARLLSQTDAPVLLHGESGVGKEQLARAIHEEGARRSAPFVAVQCSGISQELLARELFGYVDTPLLGARTDGSTGKIEAARGGTLFLKDIGQMPVELQPFLLRVLETAEVYPLGSTVARPVEFRLICSCSSDLLSEVRAGRFRMDLYYRIAWSAVPVPALHERSEDIPLLVEHFAQETTSRLGTGTKRFAPEVLDALTRYCWPGNVRELRNVVESMVLLTPGELVDVTALPDEINIALERESMLPPANDDSAVGLERVERNAIGECLRAHAGNLTRTARELRIARSTLYAKLKKYGLEGSVGNLRFTAQKRPHVDTHGRS